MPSLVVKATFGAPHYSNRQATAATKVTVTVITAVHFEFMIFYCVDTHTIMWTSLREQDKNPN
jgi:hypothetical protein